MKKIFMSCFILLLIVVTSMQLVSAFDSKGNKNSYKEIINELKEDNLFIYIYGSNFKKTFENGRKIDTLQQNYTGITSKYKALIITSDKYEEIISIDKNYFLNLSKSGYSIFFVGKENIDIIKSYIGINPEYKEQELYMIGLVSSDKEIYPTFYVRDINFGIDDDIQNKIYREIWTTVNEKDLYPKHNEQKEDTNDDVSTIQLTDYDNLTYSSGSNLYILTDWFNTDFTVKDTGDYYADVRLWTRVLAIEDLQDNQKEYYIVNKRAYISPKNNTGDNMRTDYVNSTVDVDENNTDWLLFEYGPEIESPTSTFSYSVGTSIGSNNSTTSSASWKINYSELKFSIGSTELDTFNPRFDYVNPYRNNVNYYTNRTCQAWSYIIQDKTTDGTQESAVINEETHVGMVRDGGLFVGNDEDDDDVTISLTITPPTRNTNGTIKTN